MHEQWARIVASHTPQGVDCRMRTIVGQISTKRFIIARNYSDDGFLISSPHAPSQPFGVPRAVTRAREFGFFFFFFAVLQCRIWSSSIQLCSIDKRWLMKTLCVAQNKEHEVKAIHVALAQLNGSEFCFALICRRRIKGMLRARYAHDQTKKEIGWRMVAMAIDQR